MEFLHAFKLACENNRVHEGASMSSLPFFLKKAAAAALTARLFLKSRSWHGTVSEYMLTSHFQVVNYLLDTGAMDNIIKAADTEIVRFTNMWLLEYPYPLNEDPAFPTSVRCVCTKRTASSIEHSTHSFWSNIIHAALQKLAY